MKEKANVYTFEVKNLLQASLIVRVLSAVSSTEKGKRFLASFLT